MRSTVELIAAKRDGEELTDGEILSLIDAYSNDRLPDYQMSAMAMAIYFKGLNSRETATWTKAMLHSGVVLDLAELGPGRVDKHSTGGVGDKISLPLAPAAAAAGCIVPMVSGRGLGHTGGTIDKLEAIPGYRADLDIDAFKAVLRQTGCSIIGQTGDVAPADKRLYALRDVTGTVSSLPLITASIMSKKLAEGIEGLVLDVKVGRGAFMKTIEDARRLAQSMVDIGESMNVRVVAFLTRMEEPLGRMVGNACEILETMETLSGGGPPEIRELVTTLGGAMVEIAHGVSREEGVHRIAAALDNGTAMARWQAMVAAQGGCLEDIPEPEASTPVKAMGHGFVAAIDGLEVGLCGVMLGAGRQKQDDAIDPMIGIRIARVRGESVHEGDTLATVYHRSDCPPDEAAIKRLRDAFTLVDDAVEPAPMILERIG